MKRFLMYGSVFVAVAGLAATAVIGGVSVIAAGGGAAWYLYAQADDVPVMVATVDEPSTVEAVVEDEALTAESPDAAVEVVAAASPETPPVAGSVGSAHRSPPPRRSVPAQPIVLDDEDDDLDFLLDLEPAPIDVVSNDAAPVQEEALEDFELDVDFLLADGDPAQADPRGRRRKK